MSAVHRPTRRGRRILVGLLSSSLLVVAGCAAKGIEREKKFLAEHGTLDAEWQIRDEANKKTHTYVLLRTGATHETYEIVATDGQRNVKREHAGGIDATGCYLTMHGPTTPWILQKGLGGLEDAPVSNEKIRTACLEYKDTGAWMFIPEKDRKAAEPPPPPPEVPATPPEGMTPDGATPEGGATTPEDKGDVKSALPL